MPDEQAADGCSRQPLSPAQCSHSHSCRSQHVQGVTSQHSAPTCAANFVGQPPMLAGSSRRSSHTRHSTHLCGKLCGEVGNVEAGDGVHAAHALQQLQRVGWRVTVAQGRAEQCCCKHGAAQCSHQASGCAATSAASASRQFAGGASLLRCAAAPVCRAAPGCKSAPPHCQTRTPLPCGHRQQTGDGELAANCSAAAAAASNPGGGGSGCAPAGTLRHSAIVGAAGCPGELEAAPPADSTPHPQHALSSSPRGLAGLLTCR